MIVVWTLTEKLTKQIDGCYTRLLRTALGITWDQFLTNEELYGNLPKLSDKIRRRRVIICLLVTPGEARMRWSPKWSSGPHGMGNRVEYEQGNS